MTLSGPFRGAIMSRRAQALHAAGQERPALVLCVTPTAECSVLKQGGVGVWKHAALPGRALSGSPAEHPAQ